MPVKTLIVIAGPTAVGKTALSIAIAKELRAPIVSADSRQFFKELSIGTAKPSKEEMQGVPHYMIDSHSITEEYNVGKYESEVIPLLDDLFRENDQVILTGGSGLYIDAVCKGLDELPEADPGTRNKIAEILAAEGIEGLQKLLEKLDPEYYGKVDLNNPQRLSRALEVCISSGKAYSSLRKGSRKKRNFEIVKIGLNMDRAELYRRIDRRVDEMMKAGLLNEVRSLYENRAANALQTVGYKDLFDHIDGKSDLSSAIDQIKQNTRNFAKRQLTWFRRDGEIKWFEPGEKENILAYIQQRIRV
ncbi:MAG: tRNA (adenosine(37)-N6)-dimethylallyltransferase MiaA [Bacteroidia bacterium]